ncbi:MFS transporter [Phytohabitans aurantiacus]|uniref:MFS transporter n=1 Tax=Phytohabitans aurantiacus TaxID=3016789 RepID=A0ABQ5QXQ1_9ACTN|nr:MFS transporter [Phytohabitans aurantiacus]GLH99080.1 MFS transporter [Phytohabitans aurantiacus]
MSPLLRLLIGTQLAFNVGFFAVLPYLAGHLGDELGLAGWLVGLVLGLRTFSQQGLFVVGGALTDRFGARPVVLVGCALRAAGFASLAYAGSTPAVIGAVLLIGVAAALFSPAVESEVARQAVRHERETGRPRTEVLAVLAVAGQVGAFTGPLLGALLLLVDFRAACLAGAAIFVAILCGHAWLMPRRTPGAPHAAGHRHTLDGLRLLVRNRRFLALSLAFSTYLLAYNQLYLAVPARLDSPTAVAMLFAFSSALVIVAQLPLTRWASRRLAPRTAVSAGLLTIAAGFAAGAAVPSRMLSMAALVALLTVGQMLAVPVIRAWLPDLVEDAHLGLYTGALSSISGAVVLAGSAASGALLDTGGALVWLALAAMPVAGVAAVRAAARPRAAKPAVT